MDICKFFHPQGWGLKSNTNSVSIWWSNHQIIIWIVVDTLWMTSSVSNHSIVYVNWKILINQIFIPRLM